MKNSLNYAIAVALVFVLTLGATLFPVNVDAGSNQPVPQATVIRPSIDNSSLPQFTTYPIPALNSKIQLPPGVTAKTSTLQDNTWFFTGLSKDGKSSTANLHISATNCTVLIGTPSAQLPTPYSSVDMKWTGYTVEGAGTQTLNPTDVFPDGSHWTKWKININGQNKQEGDGWSYPTPDNLTITTPDEQSNVQISAYHIPAYSSIAPLPEPNAAQTNFTSTDLFQIPYSNSTINFATAGSYDKATLDHGNWNFINLTLNSYQIDQGVFAPNVTGRNVLPYIFQSDFPANIGIAGQNCNMTITGITPLTWYSIPNLNYTVQGNGNQTITFPFKLSTFNLQVKIDGVSKQTNDGWYVTNDNQIRITTAAANVSIVAEETPKVSTPVVSGPPIMPLIAGVILVALVLCTAVLLVNRRKSKTRSNLCQ